MKKYALLGKSLSHSFSEQYFSEKFLKEGINNTEYINLELDNLNNLKYKIKQLNLSGFNVTIPYKIEIISKLDFVSNQAKTINAVNTVKVIEGKLHGFNTDVIGFTKSIVPQLNKRKTALVLGNGGSSKAIQFALHKLNINWKVVSRNTDFDYRQITKETIDSVEIIINCTPLGTYPKIEEYPQLPYNLLNSKHLLYDLVYNPKETKFLTFGLANNCSIKNGEEMLVLQAEESWKIWNSDIR
ncbi:MAG: shikimate dehydrogenase [Flavobacteriales bacterium]|jgi:shikimate dehydrogenase|nr:shikimate dehydrogenase [Flavobacteriales bacterium]MBT7620655.1 shikimate dehydrogenase [Flavobacteriales bacterium]